MSITRFLWLFLAASGLFAPAGVAQQHAHAKLYTRVAEGEVRAAIQIRIDPGWHLYHSDLGHPEAIGKPLRIALSGEGVLWSEVRLGEPERYEDGIEEGVWTWVHHGKVLAHAVGRLAEGADAQGVSAGLSGLTCQSDGLCVPYDEQVESRGEGPEAVFAGFPADLEAPAAAEVPAARSSTAATDAAGKAAQAPSFGPIDLGGGPIVLGGGEGEKVSAQLFVRSAEGEARAVIRIVVAQDWHIYHGPTREDLGPREPIAEPTTLVLEPGDWQVVFPEPEVYPEGLSGIDYEATDVHVHHGEVLLTARGRLPEGKSLADVRATLAGQACDPQQCLPFELLLEPEGPGSDALFASFAAPPVAAADGAKPEGLGEQNLWAFLLLAVGWGLFTLLMPCTYPMIPITISFFTKQAIAREGKVLSLALAYGVGIVLIFILIGVVLGPPIITFAVHPVTNLVIGLLFLFFAFVLFGAIDLQPPAFLMRAAGKASSKGGLAGVFLMGATLVVTSFTCTAPFVGSLLTFGASGAGQGAEGLLRIVLGMGVFGLTMATPFVLLSLVPGRLQRIPKAGEWMHVLKVFLGFVELAAALKFFSNSDLLWEWGILSRELFLLIWLGIFLAAALFLWGWIKLEGEHAERIGPWRMTGGLGALLFSLYCGMGVLGYHLDDVMTAIIPPYSSQRLAGAPGTAEGGSEARGTHEIVTDDLERAREVAREQGKLVLVNFTGHT